MHFSKFKEQNRDRRLVSAEAKAVERETWLSTLLCLGQSSLNDSITDLTKCIFLHLMYVYLISRLNSEWIWMQMHWNNLENSAISQPPKHRKINGREKKGSWFFVVPFPLTFSAQCKVIPPHQVSCVALWKQIHKSQRPQGHHPEQAHNRGTQKTISSNISTDLYTPEINEAREWSSSFPRWASSEQVSGAVVSTLLREKHWGWHFPPPVDPLIHRHRH